jgi:hypothetical protein
MQVLSLPGKDQRYFGDNTAQFFIDSSPICTAEKKEITAFKSYIFYCEIFKRALYNALPKCGKAIGSYSYCFVLLSLWPHVHLLSLCTVIATGKLVALSLL